MLRNQHEGPQLWKIGGLVDLSPSMLRLISSSVEKTPHLCHLGRLGQHRAAGAGGMAVLYLAYESHGVEEGGGMTHLFIFAYVLTANH